MSKRFYVEIAVIMLVSILLLGLSFSKESGTNIKFSTTETNTDKLRVVYGNGKYISQNNSTHFYSIVNKSSEEVTYDVYITEINNKKDYKLSYVLNDEEIEVKDNYLMKINLKPYGTDGDRLGLRIFYKIEDPDLEFKLEFGEEAAVKSNSFFDKLKEDANVYVDKEGSIRYFGKNVNNYINYSGTKYRMIGVVDGKLLLLGEEKILTRYEPNGSAEYVTVKDYLGSLETHDLDIEGAKGLTSWIVDDHDYWLQDKQSDSVVYYADKYNGIGTLPATKFLYNRFVVTVEGTPTYVSGDGSSGNPYEVSYES